MRKLFLHNPNCSNIYTKQLALAYDLVSHQPKTKISNINEIEKDYLKKFDVIISNSLPKSFESFAREKRIITIYIDDYSNKNNCDFLIDYKHKFTTDHFTGKKYKILNNKRSQFDFELLFNIVVILEWDSKFWGYPVALITSRKLSNNIIYRVNLFLKKNKVRLIQYLCNCHDRLSVNYAEMNNYRFKDIRLTFERSLNKKNMQRIEVHNQFRKAITKDFKDLKKISKSIYKDSRYYFDTNFDVQKVQEFYDQWLYKAIKNLYDNECLIYCIKNKPVAYCTLKYLNKETAVIGLLGVGKYYSGKGYGKILMQQVYNFLIKKSIEKILVVTQGRNFQAQRFYQKENFLIANTELWYHKWI
tara:strand:+ start:17692 stop:18768 length:1077 start_codon:yes stop_codon:yes gene_type:complete